MMAERQMAKCIVCLNCFALLTGFLATLVAAKPTLESSNGDKCDFHLTASSGDISSPNYPQQYPQNTVCQWNIVMPASETIGLVFGMFDIEPSTSGLCEKDYVKIFDGSTGLGKYCSGNRPPRQITSSTNTLRIVFISDNHTASIYPGFLASYASCGGYLTEPRGYVTSPGYPIPFPDDIQCIWQIRVPEDYVVEIRFDDFYMDGEFPCNLDYVKVRDGVNVSATQIGHYCASRQPSPKPIRSTGNTMWLEFNSFQESTSRGFKAHYTRAQHCGGFLETDYGRFTSPGYPGSRQVDHECSWIITVTEGKVVSLMFDTFEVDSENVSSHDCARDYVEVYDGTDQTETAKPIGKFCRFGHNPPPRLRSSGRQMMVKLKTSFINKGNGFLASYYGVDPSNYFVGCAEFAHQLLFTCDNGKKVHCQWKCDGTNDCDDGSDERHCTPTAVPTIKKTDDIRNYVIIILSITGSVLAIVCIGFIVDHLRKKRTTRPRRRRGQRRRHTRLSNTDDAPLTENSEPSSPPPPYELAVDDSSCGYFGVSFLQPHLSRTSPSREGEANAEPPVYSHQSPSQQLAGSPQGNDSLVVRTNDSNVIGTQSSVEVLQPALSELDVTSGLNERAATGEQETDSRSTSGNTVSPSVSVDSFNDTAPLILRSDSVVEL